MESSPSFRASQSQGAPLYPVSPERINQQRIPPSPSRGSEFSSPQKSPSKLSSEVQSKVAFLNGLARTNSPGPGPVHNSATTSAALQRAILGREEAESALEGAVSQLSEARTRERKISERVESLLEELQSAKKHQTHERTVFEKEVRKARKEAFRAGSAVVKAQEELKSTRSEIKGLKDEVKSEREAKDQAKQEAFEHAYKLASVTEELTVLKEKLRSLETDNHSDELEARAREMQDQTPKRPVLAEKYIGAITPTPMKSRNQPKKKTPSNRTLLRKARGRTSAAPLFVPLLRRPSGGHRRESSEISRRESYKENMDPEVIDEDYVDDLKDDIKLEKRLRLEAEERVEMMKIECQFLSCECRVAERRGERYVYDVEYDQRLQEQERQRKMQEEERGDFPGTSSRGTAVEEQVQYQPPNQEDVTMKDTETHETQQGESVIAFSPTTGTFRPTPSPAKVNPSWPELRESVKEETDYTGASVYQQPPAPRTTPSPQPSSQDFHMEDTHPSQHFKASASKVEPPSPFATNPPNLYAFQTPSRSGSGESNATITQEQVTADNNHHRTSSAITETVTKTTTVPLQSENRERTSNPYATIPGTPVTRQEALAQIQARRGRARSNANRSLSASEINSRPPSRARAVTPVRKGRKAPATEHRERSTTSHSKERRHISAPIGRY